MQDLSIIIVNYNTGDYLKKCIDSIFLQTTRYNFDIYVIDNNSQDNSISFIHKYYPQIKLINNNKNMGFAAANNQALKEINSQFILLLNPDTEIINNAIDKMIDYMKNGEYQLLTCKLLNSDLSLQKSIYEFEIPSEVFIKKKIYQVKRFFTSLPDYETLRTNKFNHEIDNEIDWARGAVLMFTKNVMDRIGLIDEDYYIYAEEEDYYLRAKRSGFKARYISEISIIHHGKISSKKYKTELFLIGLKSRYIYFRKNYSYFQYIFHRYSIFLFYLFNYLRLRIFKSISDEPENIKFCKDVIKWHLSKISILKVKKTPNY